MSERCIGISIVVCFLIFTATVYIIPYCLNFSNFGPASDIDTPTLTLFRNSYHPEVDQVQCNLSDAGVKSPSLESFIEASTTDENQELRLRGLAVTSNLKNACQPLNDVSKAKIQVNKFALVTLKSETVSCPLQDLAVHAQNAGYSVLIYFKKANQSIIIPTVGPTQVTSEGKILIPVIISERKCAIKDVSFFVDDRSLVTADQTNVEIRMQVLPPSKELSKMETYLNHLYYWFLVGPIITVVWMIRTKKFFLKSESEIGTMQEGENRDERSDTEETTPINHQGRHEEQSSMQRILSVNADYNTRARGTRYQNSVRKFLNKAAECFGYLVLIIAALPVGISFGGLSFFRFDEGSSSVSFIPATLWWPTFQIFCFFMYSRFTRCKTNWTVPTNFSKLIRSDWFALNIYLLVLGVVPPYCSLKNTRTFDSFGYFAIYNTVCTFCNVLFLIILNKHKVVTSCVFYISVCVICAYIESDIVALFYFAFNSEGSLNNFNLTALRTAAIGLTLVVSFRTSMHIIQKLTAPGQSLFEGLGEQ